jgi:type IV pilus assembly protein PilW
MILLAAGIYIYTNFLKGALTEGETTEKQIERIVALELLRLDLEHLGYGVGKKLTDEYKIYEFDNTNQTLTIRSTLNNSNNSTIGWRICDDGNLAVQQLEGSNDNFVYVDSYGYIKDIKTHDDKCPDKTYYPGKLIGYPFDENATGCEYDTINFCTEITYYLSNSSLPKKCNPNTYNLLRKVNNDTGGDPLLSCVADIKFTVDLDTDDDGKIDTYNSLTAPTTPKDLRGQTKRISVYILYQEAFDPNHTFSPDGSDSTGDYVERDGIKLYLPPGYQHYRWKVIKISVKPMSIIK